MLKKELVTIIIPYYCASLTIERALTSVFNQTYKNFEIIIVDDCSNNEVDDEILLKIKQNYPLITVLNLEKNGGPSRARNIGWDKAQGEYIAFLDSDDSWHPQKLEIQVKFMQNNKSLYMSGHKCAILENPYSQDMSKINFKQIAFKIIKYKELLLSNRFSTPSVMIRNNNIYRFNESMKFSEDYNLWLDIASDSKEMGYIDYPLGYLYKERFGESGLSSQLWKMGKGEQTVYNNLYAKEKLNLPNLFFLKGYSFLKLIRRFILVKIRNSNLKDREV